MEIEATGCPHLLDICVGLLSANRCASPAFLLAAKVASLNALNVAQQHRVDCHLASHNTLASITLTFWPNN